MAAERFRRGQPTTTGDTVDRPRTAWQAQFARFALKETKPDAQTDAHDGFTRVHGEDLDVELPDAEFVSAAAARLDDSSRLDAQTRAYLSVTP